MYDWETTCSKFQDAFGNTISQVGALYFRSLYEYAAMIPKPCRILEVGTNFGQSTFVMACALHGTTSHIISVDPIHINGHVVCTDGHHPWSSYNADSRELLARLGSHDLAHLVSLVPGFSEYVYDHWSGGMFDLVFIDGAHTYEAVKLDCRWLDHVTPGGFAVFDDWIEPVERAVLEYIAGKPWWKVLQRSTEPPRGHWIVTLLQRDSG